MVGIVQLARTPDCGSGGRRFESDRSPHEDSGSVSDVVCRIAGADLAIIRVARTMASALRKDR